MSRPPLSLRLHPPDFKDLVCSETGEAGALTADDGGWYTSTGFPSHHHILIDCDCECDYDGDGDCGQDIPPDPRFTPRAC